MENAAHGTAGGSTHDPRMYPLGWSTEPGGLPTLAEFRAIKRERCRYKLAAERTKALAVEVVSAFGVEAARPVLARRGLTVSAAGEVRSVEEERMEDQWAEIVWGMYQAHGTGPLALPRDTRVDPQRGCVAITPHSHDALEAPEGAGRGPWPIAARPA
jgi:hypothetical protein